MSFEGTNQHMIVTVHQGRMAAERAFCHNPWATLIKLSPQHHQRGDQRHQDKPRGLFVMA